MPYSSSEAAARRQYIDPALGAAGWNVRDTNQVGIEVPVDGPDGEPWNGVTDYCLYRANGEVLAVVEAKKKARDPNVAREQVAQYVAAIPKQQASQSFTPFAFFSNGQDTYFHDPAQLGPPRLVAGFFTRADLERLLNLRQTAVPFEQVTVDPAIAGRTYQQAAIRSVIEAFTQNNKRRALLVMATGTGKTRTTVALVDLFLRANQARKVLFLADRDALVDQALRDGFQRFLPGEPNTRIYSHTIDNDKRLYVATLQTMNSIFTRFSPGAFDLIVVDEAHRSIYNRAAELWDYFDARMIGLTATPAEFIDRDTFATFDCTGKIPTYLYTYREAVDEKHLVDFHLYKARTGFQRDGIRGVTLSEEAREVLIDQGIDPDELDYSGTELEKTVSNTGTLREQWEEFIETCTKDASGQPCKSIVFAMTQKHAERLRLVFEEMYPQWTGMVEVITSDTERVRDGSWGDGLLTKFRKNNLPRIAISVDMLDTGVDVPEVMNLAFMKPVQSRIKLWQMIGRGTRSDEACVYRDRLPERGKTDFKILDFWENDFERQTELPTGTTLPVLVTLFNTRLRLLEAQMGNQNTPDAQQTKADLRLMIDRIPRDSFAVKRVFPEIERAWDDSFWTYVIRPNIDFLKNKVGPLLRLAAQVDVAAETFTGKMERLKLQALQHQVTPEQLQSIAEDVALLPNFVQTDAVAGPACRLCLSPDLQTATPAELSQAITALAPHMRNRRTRESAFLQLDLPDFMAERGYITLSENGERVYVDEYRKRVEEAVKPLAENHPTVMALRSGEDVSDADLIALERDLRGCLNSPNIEGTLENIRRAYGFRAGSFLSFLRHLLTLEGVPDYETVVRRAWENHIAEHLPAYTSEQIQFLRVVEEVFVRKGRLSLADLYDEPAIARLGTNRVERIFAETEIQEMLDVSEKLTA